MSLAMQCSRHKLFFGTEENAWSCAYKLWKQRGLDLAPYKCPACKLFHLSSKRKRLPEWLIEKIDRDTKA